MFIWNSLLVRFLPRFEASRQAHPVADVLLISKSGMLSLFKGQERKETEATAHTTPCISPCTSLFVAQITGYRARRTYYEIRKANIGIRTGKPGTIIESVSDLSVQHCCFRFFFVSPSVSFVSICMTSIAYILLYQPPSVETRFCQK